MIYVYNLWSRYFPVNRQHNLLGNTWSYHNSVWKYREKYFICHPLFISIVHLADVPNQLSNHWCYDTSLVYLLSFYQHQCLLVFRPMLLCFSAIVIQLRYEIHSFCLPFLLGHGYSMWACSYIRTFSIRPPFLESLEEFWSSVKKVMISQ